MSELRYRPAAAEDLPFLATMLGEAAAWRPEQPTPSGEEVLADPRYATYLAGWPRAGDHGHGFVGEDVPELAIAVVADRRGEGRSRSGTRGTR